MNIKTFPSEKSIIKDNTTGNQIIKWTNSSYLDRHLYFTSNSVTADNNWLIFLSERDRNPNLYAIDRNSGIIKQITYNKNGTLYTYVWPGNKKKGLSKAAPCLDIRSSIVYGIIDNYIFSYNLNTGKFKKLIEIPTGYISSFTDISPDGKILALPLTPELAFLDKALTQQEQLHIIPKSFEKFDLKSKILFYNINKNKIDIAAEVPFWTTHVQFDPSNSGKLIFNKEGVNELGQPRIWCRETDAEIRQLYHQSEDIIEGHENFSSTGKYIISHGWQNEISFLSARTWNGTLKYKYNLNDFKLGHLTMCQNEKSFISDGIENYLSICTPKNKNKIAVKHLCRIKSNLADQDTHTHARITPDGNNIIFSSIIDGNCNIYEIKSSDK